jgi:hypothetical protein
MVFFHIRPRSQTDLLRCRWIRADRLNLRPQCRRIQRLDEKAVEPIINHVYLPDRPADDHRSSHRHSLEYHIHTGVDITWQQGYHNDLRSCECVTDL